MKRLLLSLFIPVIAFAQQGGVRFESGLTWPEIQAKARAEGKYVFVSCNATWCGPCKFMMDGTFRKDSVGAFMNEHFINVAVQMDTTAEDSEEVMAWRATADSLRRAYEVVVYPTYLIFAPDGRPAHRLVGSYYDFLWLPMLIDGLQPEKQYYTLLQAFDAGKRDTASTKRLAEMSTAYRDWTNGARVVDGFMEACGSGVYDYDNLDFIRRQTQSSKGASFAFLRDEGPRIDGILGEGASADALSGVIIQEEFYPLLVFGDRNPDYDVEFARMQALYPWADLRKDKELMLLYDFEVKDSDSCARFAERLTPFMEAYIDRIDARAALYFIRQVAQHCSDEAFLLRAIDWAEANIGKEKIIDELYIEAIARMCYKTGQAEEAKQRLLGIIGTTEGDERKRYEELLGKIERGEAI